MRDDFKPVLGYPDYKINSEGIIISYKRKEPRQLCVCVDDRGYRQTRLTRDKVTTTCKVHRLVWEAFKGEVPEGLHILHGCGNDISNCNLEYLSLGTHSDNMGRDRRRDGTLPCGESHGRSKLMKVQVDYIRARAKDGMKHYQLASLFKVHKSTISGICRNESW
jgi:hypothetical protein